MKKNQVYIIIVILFAAAAAWFGYRYFFKKEVTVSGIQKRSIQDFASNSCWVYHEFVYRVDFSDPALESFLFIRNEDGTFSPSEANREGNHIISNGFIIDSTGACVITEKTATPWILTDDEQILLKELVDAWLDLKPEITNRDYRITGQTVALFVVLNNPKEFIEYAVSAPVPGQQGYSLAYPFQKTLLTGIQPAIEFSALTADQDTSVLQILKTSFDENNTENPLTKTSVDSISATRSVDGYLENIKIFSGDDFFYEGSAVFDHAARLLGNLHYENKKWTLVPFTSFVQNPPTYAENEIQEKWAYDLATPAWKRIHKTNNANEATVNEETYKPGPLEPTIKVYPSPTPQ